jgi:hypothetical protein
VADNVLHFIMDRKCREIRGDWRSGITVKGKSPVTHLLQVGLIIAKSGRLRW